MVKGLRWLAPAVLAMSCVAGAGAPEGLLYLARFDDYAGANWAVGSRRPEGTLAELPPQRPIRSRRPRT